jgi:hypothetical protein
MRRRLTKQLQALMQPTAGFASDGDWAGAVSGFAAVGQQQQQVGVLQACQRAAAAHRLFQQRLLPKLKVRTARSSWLFQLPTVETHSCILLLGGAADTRRTRMYATVPCLHGPQTILCFTVPGLHGLFRQRLLLRLLPKLQVRCESACELTGVQLTQGN